MALHTSPPPLPHTPLLSPLFRVYLGLTKLHLWNLTHFSKVVYLDADTIVLNNVDEVGLVQTLVLRGGELTPALVVVASHSRVVRVHGSMMVPPPRTAVRSPWDAPGRCP
jgi:hypothetical protein